MAEDIVPALNKEITRAFERNMMTDKRAARLGELIRDGTKDFTTAHKYAEVTGSAMSRALRDTLTADKLPNGNLYYNIADRTVTPALKTVHGLNTKAAADIQRSIDAAEDIGLTPIIPDFPAERAAGLVNKMAMSDTLEKAHVWLEEAIINSSESYVDDFIHENAEARYNAGLEVTLTRTAAGGCCAWCSGLAGVYEYGNHPAEVFQRHEYCRCLVIYKNGKTVQSAWSKRTWSTPEEVAERKKIQPDYTPPDVMQQEYTERMERDRDIAEIVKETGFSRRTVQYLLGRRKLTPEQIISRYGRR